MPKAFPLIAGERLILLRQTVADQSPNLEQKAKHIRFLKAAPQPLADLKSGTALWETDLVNGADFDSNEFELPGVSGTWQLSAVNSSDTHTFLRLQGGVIH